MRILIPTIGSRGDVQPFVALAQGLNRAGYAVTLASHPVMKRLVEFHGVAFQPIGPDIDLAQEVATIRQNSRNTAAGLIRVMRFSFDMLQRSHENILALGQESDLMVVSAQSAAGKNEADMLGLPYLSVSLMPWAIPWHDPQRPLMKRTVYGLIDRLVGLITTRPLNNIRKKQGLPPVGKEGFTSLRLNLIPVSPAVYEPNSFWESRHRMVGYWFAEEPAGWEPTRELVSFLESDDPVVLISLGAMSLGQHDAKEMLGLFVGAVQRVGIRAIIQSWQKAAAQMSLPSTIYMAGSIPHSWLLPHCSALVHHGGFGTTSAGLRAGIPALVIPHIADQFFWAKRIQELGAGPTPVSRAKLSESSLETSLTDLVNNADLRSAANNLGEKIRSENGLDNAVCLIAAEFG